MAMFAALIFFTFIVQIVKFRAKKHNVQRTETYLKEQNFNTATGNSKHKGNRDDGFLFVWAWGNVALVFGLMYGFDELFELFSAFGIFGLAAALIFVTALFYNFFAFFILAGGIVAKVLKSRRKLD